MSKTPPTNVPFDDFDEVQAYSCSKGGHQAVLVKQLLEGPMPFKLVPNNFAYAPLVPVFGKFGASYRSWQPLRKRLRDVGFMFHRVWTIDGKGGYIEMAVDKRANLL